ncbi:MAG: hypothetical protein ACI8RD_008605 [Bacillariaceae sp.]|jgi:hypothetical protein
MKQIFELVQGYMQSLINYSCYNKRLELNQYRTNKSVLLLTVSTFFLDINEGT